MNDTPKILVLALCFLVALLIGIIIIREEGYQEELKLIEDKERKAYIKLDSLAIDRQNLEESVEYYSTLADSLALLHIQD